MHISRRRTRIWSFLYLCARPIVPASPTSRTYIMRLRLVERGRVPCCGIGWLQVEVQTRMLQVTFDERLLGSGERQRRSRSGRCVRIQKRLRTHGQQSGLELVGGPFAVQGARCILAGRGGVMLTFGIGKPTISGRAGTASRTGTTPTSACPRPRCSAIRRRSPIRSMRDC